MSPEKWPCGECHCDADGCGYFRYKILDVLEPTYRCLRKMVTDRSWALLAMHRHYLQGNLAIEGGICNQPGVYLDAMALITEWMAHGSSGDS